MTVYHEYEIKIKPIAGQSVAKVMSIHTHWRTHADTHTCTSLAHTYTNTRAHVFATNTRACAPTLAIKY